MGLWFWQPKSGASAYHVVLTILDDFVESGRLSLLNASVVSNGRKTFISKFQLFFGSQKFSFWTVRRGSKNILSFFKFLFFCIILIFSSGISCGPVGPYWAIFKTSLSQFFSESSPIIWWLLGPKWKHHFKQTLMWLLLAQIWATLYFQHLVTLDWNPVVPILIRQWKFVQGQILTSNDTSFVCFN